MGLEIVKRSECNEMPKEYYQQMAVLLHKARISAVLSWVIVVCPIIILSCWRYNSFLSQIFACIFILLIVAIYFDSKMHKSRTKEILQPWTISCRNTFIPLKTLNAVEVHPGVYFASLIYDSMKIRVLIQYEDLFDSTAYKRRAAANKKANKIFAVSKHTTIADSAKLVRVNIAICEEENNELRQWIQNTVQTLWRVESIINFAVIKNGNKLLVPKILGQYDIGMIKKYMVAVEWASQLLF